MQSLKLQTFTTNFTWVFRHKKTNHKMNDKLLMLQTHCYSCRGLYDFIWKNWKLSKHNSNKLMHSTVSTSYNCIEIQKFVFKMKRKVDTEMITAKNRGLDQLNRRSAWARSGPGLGPVLPCPGPPYLVRSILSASRPQHNLGVTVFR